MRNNKTDSVLPDEYRLRKEVDKPLTIKLVIIRISVIISLVELLIMMFLEQMPYGFHNSFHTSKEAFLDAALLVGLSMPLIYILVVKPFVIARDETVSQITHIAFHDPLTQLANRHLLLEHLEKVLAGCARHEIYGALLLIDLDGFKPVNDTHGHDAGDALLIEIAKRLKSVTRSEDLVSRIGGDEFVILIQRLDVDEQIAHDKVIEIAEKLQKLLNKPVEFKDKKLQIGCSSGIRLLGFEAIGVEGAIREADTAMYHAKQAGGGCIVFFEK